MEFRQRNCNQLLPEIRNLIYTDKSITKFDDNRTETYSDINPNLQNIMQEDEIEEYTSDEGKRKRNIDCGEGAFSKSKRILRTPQKPKINEDKLDKMMEMMQVLMQDIKEIKIEQRSYQEEMKKIKEENAEIKKQNEELRTELKTIHSRLEYMDRDKRRHNIVVTGLTLDNIQQDMIEVEMKSFFRKNMEIEPKMKEIKKIGPKVHLIELEDGCEKREVMRNKAKLKNYRREKVFIMDDLTKKQRDIQRKLGKIAREEREKGKTVKEAFQKLFIDNIQYRWNDENECIEQLPSKN